MTNRLFLFIPLFLFISCAPIFPEKYCETEEEYILSEYTDGFWYGNGLGIAAVNVGASVSYPPYALYLVGNGALDVMGYEKIEVTDVLPENIELIYDQFYYGMTSIPGRVNSHVMNEEFKSPETVKENIARYRRYLHSEIEYASTK